MSQIKAEALRLGFSACGIAAAGAVPEDVLQGYQAWLGQGYQGDMAYLERNMDLRADPRKLVPGTRSLVMVAMNYYPEALQPADAPQVAYYAYGRDYHRVVKKRLDQLLLFIQTNFFPEATGRSFADSAPIMERYWAVQAGLGWIGKNGLLIIPNAGSYFVLGEILLSEALPADSPQPNRCGRCELCITSCPTSALYAPGRMDARRCISYLTIEQAEEIPTELAEKMQSRIYGCDACQQCCPWNRRFAQPTTVADFSPRAHILGLSYEGVRSMSEAEYDGLFAGSPMRRAGLRGLQRSLRAIEPNRDRSETVTIRKDKQ